MIASTSAWGRWEGGDKPRRRFDAHVQCLFGLVGMFDLFGSVWFLWFRLVYAASFGLVPFGLFDLVYLFGLVRFVRFHVNGQVPAVVFVKSSPRG